MAIMSEVVEFDIDIEGLDDGDQMVDLWVADLRADPITTKELMEWLLTNPGKVLTTQRHMVAVALVAATAMQRLARP